MFIPHTEADRETMLKAIGLQEMKDLFQYLPDGHTFPDLDIPQGLTEMETLAELKSISGSNESTEDLSCFLGAGAYNHYIPASINALIKRGEFLTAYTPYQPEISQGTLQAIFEYQSLMAALTDMDAANASHYDGATAIAEAVTLAANNFRGKRSRVILSPNLHPHYVDTVRTYVQGINLEIIGDQIPFGSSPDSLLPYIDDNTALVMLQYPDFAGRVFDLTEIIEKTHDHNALFGAHINPMALGLFKSPGTMGADLITGEGQPLGIPLSFGGPYLGIFATKKKYIRKMAGRIVGETSDSKGNRGYVLTLSTREQHIRRERATSNICTNQGLMALASTVYLSLLGESGLREVAELNYQKAHHAANLIGNIPGYELIYEGDFFNEFVINCPKPASEINKELLDRDILGGLDLNIYYPEKQNHLLICVTEMISNDEINHLVESLREIAND